MYDVCGAVVTYMLMEDIVEFCTIEDAEHVFYYLETRIEALRSLYANFEKSPAKMAALRILNQLSRRCAPYRSSLSRHGIEQTSLNDPVCMRLGFLASQGGFSHGLRRRPLRGCSGCSPWGASRFAPPPLWSCTAGCTLPTALQSR